MHVNMERSSSFWAGFSDCTEEAIAFLLESESITESDPIIQGLREHLRQKQTELGLNEENSKHNSNIASTSSKADCSDISLNENMDTDATLDRTDEGYNSSLNITNSDLSLSNISFSTEEFTSSTTQNLVVVPSLCGIAVEGSQHTTFSVSPISNTVSTIQQQEVSHTINNNTTNIPTAHTVTVNSFAPIMHAQVLPPEVTQDLPLRPQFISNAPVSNSHQYHSHQHPESTFCDPFQDPMSLAILAQNNPQIACVAQELIQLLSEECDDSLLCEEDDIDDEEDADDVKDEEDVGDIDLDVVDHKENSRDDRDRSDDSSDICVSVPVSVFSVSDSVNSAPQSHSELVVEPCDDKENCHPEMDHQSPPASYESMVHKEDNSLADDTIQNTVLRLSPHNM